MKNLYTKNEFLNLRQNELLNEGLLGKMFKFLWTSTVKLAKKIKGSKEIDVVYDKYKKIIDSTFAKMTNVEHVSPAGTDQSGTIAKPTTANASYSYNDFNKINEADVIGAVKGAVKGAVSGAVSGAKAGYNQQKPTGNQTQTTNKTNTTNQQQNNQQQNNQQKPQQQNNQNNQQDQEKENLSKLNPDQIKKIADLTTKQIENEKKKFETEINNIVNRLSKSAEYSSDKLIQYGVVKKNEFDSYVYDQWHNLYQKVGDQKKLAEIDKIKKQKDETFKQAVDELTGKVNGQQQMQIGKGGQYLYNSKADNKDITVEIIGLGLGKDENGKPDAADPNHNTMHKVKNIASGNSFWVDPDELKKQIKAGKPAGNNNQLATNIKKGETYKRKVTSKNSPNYNKFINVKVKDINKKAGTATVSTGKTDFQTSLSSLKPLKKAAEQTTAPAPAPVKK